MGFALEMFAGHPNMSYRAAQAEKNGVVKVKPGEIKIHEVDMQLTNSIDGNISVQGIASHDTKIEIYYSNWIAPIDPESGLQLTDSFNIQGNDSGLALWFKYDLEEYLLPAQTPKHYQVILPICRFVRIVVRNTHAEEMSVAVYSLFV